MAGTTDTVPAMLTPGEFVIKQESAAMLGEPLLRKLNAISDNAAHSNIDALIAQSQLVNMKPMYGGGEVVPGYENGGDVGEYSTREKPGRYKDPIHKYISDMILAGKQDMLGGLLDDDYYKPLVEQELRFMNLQNLVQSAEDAIPSYSGKKEGIDLGDIFGEQSWLKQRGKKKSIRNVEDIMGETLFGQRINELYANNLYGLDNNTKGYSNGGGVGEAGRKYPPGTLMSPFMGDKAPIPEAWMQPATEPMPSPEEVAEFDRMIEMLQAQELLKKKMKEMQALGMFSDKKAIEYRDEGVQFPVRQEGYPQIKLR